MIDINPSTTKKLTTNENYQQNSALWAFVVYRIDKEECNAKQKKEKEISVLYFTGKEHLGSLTKTFYDEPDFDFWFSFSM